MCEIGDVSPLLALEYLELLAARPRVPDAGRRNDPPLQRTWPNVSSSR